MAGMITNDWVTGVLVAVLAQNMIISAAILAGRSGRSSDWRLAILLLVLALKGAPYVFGWRGHAEAPDWLAFLPINAPLAIGPLLYGYLFSRTMGREPPREWIHFIPPLFDFAYCCVCFLLPAEFRHAWKEDGHDHVAKPLLELAFVISLFVYAALSLQLTRRLRTRLVQERSDADRYDMMVLTTTVAVLAFAAIGYASIFVYSSWVAEIDLGPYFLWIALVSIGLGLEGWRAMTLPALPPRVAAPPERDRKVHDWCALGERWRDRIETAGWWREPSLSLVELSRRLAVNVNYLSRAINEGLGVNFNELINGMRASEVARRLDTGDNEDLLDMAFDAGFSSKATFNRAFHARFGTSPSAYRERLKI